MTNTASQPYIGKRGSRSMRHLFVLVAAIAAGLGVARTDAEAQGPCRTDADSLAGYVGYFQGIMAHADSARLADMALVAVPDTAIVAVSDSTTCAQALSAFKAALSDTTATSVFVIRAGASRYLVMNPLWGSGAYVHWLVFTAAFAYLDYLTG